MKRTAFLILLILALTACMPATETATDNQGGWEDGAERTWSGTPERTWDGTAVRTRDGTRQSGTITVEVYFLDENMFAVGTEPYEKVVSRTVTTGDNRARVVLDQLFLGPTAEEQAQGLAVVLSGTTGYSDIHVDDDGVAHITLTGECNSGGSTYTIANLIFANLAQFDRIKWIKIYDQNGETETPDGQSSSIPFCLEP